jgi:hypothetical protein
MVVVKNRFRFFSCDPPCVGYGFQLSMPIYEFYCPDNNTIYSFYARSLMQAGKTPRCPADPAFRMERVASTFSVTGRATEATDTANPDPDLDPRMGAALAEMEREFGSMDSDNPDPRTLARMMRRMADLTGERMPGQFDEMIRRMEAGEDPEKLEEEFGDVFGEMEPPGDESSGESEGSDKSGGFQARLRRLRPPVRDKQLYEMSDFTD